MFNVLMKWTSTGIHVICENMINIKFEIIYVAFNVIKCSTRSLIIIMNNKDSPIFKRYLDVLNLWILVNSTYVIVSTYHIKF